MKAKKIVKERDDSPHPVLVKFPAWLIEALDDEAARLGNIPRVAVIISLCDEGLKDKGRAK